MRPHALEDFAGTWRLSRTIHDRRAGRTADLTGTATLEPDGEGLRYEETGTLRIEGQPELTASRVYLWRTEGLAIGVFFEDGAPFHNFSLNRTMPEAQHHCGSDRYHVDYDFTVWPRWATEWQVLGPRKDYRMTSTYRRV